MGLGMIGTYETKLDGEIFRQTRGGEIFWQILCRDGFPPLMVANDLNAAKDSPARLFDES
jgi:hypothetical protein